MRRRPGLLLSAALLLGSPWPGCAPSTASYRPVEATTSTAAGFPAAYYRIQIGQEQLGSVKIWSPGGYPKPIEGQTVPVVELHFRIRNDSGDPIRLDVVRSDLELVSRGGVVVVVKVPVQTSGIEPIAPGAIERAVLIYELPASLKAGDVAGFELNWVLETGKGRYSQSTVFRKQDGSGNVVHNPWWYPYPYWYYEPYTGPGWGPYWGGWYDWP